MENNYLVVDMGTGNSRVALVSAEGRIWGIRSYVNRYHTDKLYEDAQYFLPEEWTSALLKGCRELTEEMAEVLESFKSYGQQKNNINFRIVMENCIKIV